MKLPNKMNRKSLSLIFSGLAIIGVGVTGFVSAIRHGAYQKRLEECGGNKTKALLTTHWPSVIAGCATVTFIVLAEKLNLKEIAVIGTLAAGLISQRDKTEEAIREICGEDVLNKIKERTNEKVVVNYLRSAGPSVEDTGRGDLLCYEKEFGRWFRSSEAAVFGGLTKFKKDFEEYCPLSFNDLYEYQGLARSTIGERYGYPEDQSYFGDESFQFDLQYFDEGKFLICDGIEPRYNDEPVLVIDILTKPIEL